MIRSTIAATPDHDFFHQDPSGTYIPKEKVVHREEEYPSLAFDGHVVAQERHFWQLGRQRFIFRAFRRESSHLDSNALHVIDFGGGCGGWLRYLKRCSADNFGELALADSSLRALELAKPVVGEDVKRYQVDLLHIPWRNRWDVAFLLDVLEHFRDDAEALRQVKSSLRPGGLLFVATPALQTFWSAEDETAHHFRRYSRKDFRRLAEETGLDLLSTRYFMFFLSPLLWLSRLGWPDPAKMTRDEIDAYKKKGTHRIPPAPLNRMLRLVFSLETPLGLWIPFPWGTSILGIFRKLRSGG